MKRTARFGLTYKLEEKELKQSRELSATTDSALDVLYQTIKEAALRYH